MKSPTRTHHSRVEVASASVAQDDDTFTVTVAFTFHPWDRPAVYPVGYAADALTAVDSVIEAGFEALEQGDRPSTIARNVQVHEAECALHEVCRETSNGLHDYSYVPSVCYRCERSCICGQLHAYGQRIAARAVDSAVGDLDATGE